MLIKVMLIMFIVMINALGIKEAFGQETTNNISQFLQRVSPSEGLSQSKVNQTIQDAQGFIWIATQMGLNRYDGYEVITISGPDDILAIAEITTLFIDNNKTLWVGTESSGLFSIDTKTLAVSEVLNQSALSKANTFQQTQLNETPSESTTLTTQTALKQSNLTPLSQANYSYSINAIEQGKGDTLWLGVLDKIFLFDTKKKSVTTKAQLYLGDHIVRALYKSTESPNPKSLKQEERDQEWLFCATSAGFYRLNILTGQVELIPHLKNNTITFDNNNTKVIIPNQSSGILLGTVGGLYQLSNTNDNDINNISSVKVVDELNIWDVILFESDYLLATNKGLYQLNTDTQLLRLMIKFSDSLYHIKDNTILDVFKDSNENLWLASKSQGVLRWSTQTMRFKNISASAPFELTNEQVLSIHQDENETLWVGTENGLNLIDLKQSTAQVFLESKDPNAIFGSHVIYQIFAHPYNKSMLWLVTDEGLQLFNKQLKQIIPAHFSQQMVDIITREEPYYYHVVDKEHIIFVSLRSHYLYNINSKKVEQLKVLNELSSPNDSRGYLPSFTLDNNEVLVASSGIVYSFNLQTHQAQLIYKIKNYRLNNTAYLDSWVIDKNNILWLAMTGEGLIGLDSKTLEEKFRFDISNILPSNNIYSLQLDEFNHLWFSSQMGIYRFNLLNFHLEHFEAEEGLLAIEYNSRAFEKLADNTVVYGATHGLTLFNPQDFITLKKPNISDTTSSVTLTDLSLLSNENRVFKPLHDIDKIILEHDEYGLNLKFSTLNYSSQSKVLYDIKLEGRSGLHYKKYNQNELLLSKLPPGKYNLVISAIDPTTGEKSVPFVVLIDSLAAPWLSLQAKSLYVLLILIFVLWYVNKRNKRRNALLLAHNKTKASEQRMMLALKSSKSGIWDYDVKKDELFDLRATEELGYTDVTAPYTSSDHFAKVAYRDLRKYEHKWKNFIQGATDYWEITYQMLSKEGEWLWYRDVGRIITKDAHGHPERVSGTYTNITQPKANEARAILFGEAFSQINDWVLIVDDKLEAVTANEAFLNALIETQEIVVPSFENFIHAFGEQKVQEFTEIIEKIEPGESWQGEEVVIDSQGDCKPVLIKINAIVNSDTKITHYVIVISDITMQKNAEEKLRHLAHYDYLTNLPNRKLILEKIEQSIETHRKSKEKSALFFIDLDKFKQVNDSLGHAVGDELLAYVANTLVQNVKAKDLVARQSGDEFMILVDSFDKIDHLSQLAQRIIKCLSVPLKLKGSYVNVSASIGIAIYPDDAQDSAQLIQKADLAMIHAKESGRSRFEFFTKEINDKAQYRILLENKIQRAFKKDAFVNFYQPIVDCNAQKLIGFELLIRWPDEEGMISPEVFIPIAEDVGLIASITEAAIERALQDLCRWQAQYENAYVSINLSAIHILQEGLAKTLKDLVVKYKVNASLVRLEITEGTLLSDQSIALKRLNELKDLGFKLLLDDFGTGYSSLTYLSQFPIDIIKIDQSFIRHIQSNSTNKPIIQSIVALASNLDISCIAEGVETEKQLSYIRSLDCNVIQGYFFAKPAPIDELLTEQYKNNVYRVF